MPAAATSPRRLAALVLPAILLASVTMSKTHAGVDTYTRPTVTVITHGFNNEATSETGWVHQLAESIAIRQSGNSYRSQGINGIGPSIYLLTIKRDCPTILNGTVTIGVITCTDVKIEWDKRKPLPFWPESNSVIIKVDWEDASKDVRVGDPRPAVSNTKIAALIVEYLEKDEFGNRLPYLELPLRLIGHSRGGSLVLSVAQQLGTRGILVEQVTTLDPHPTAVDYQGGGLFQRPSQTLLTVTDNVIFADNYRQLDDFDDVINPNGYCVKGAFNQSLSKVVKDASVVLHSVWNLTDCWRG